MAFAAKQRNACMSKSTALGSAFRTQKCGHVRANLKAFCGVADAELPGRATIERWFDRASLLAAMQAEGHTVAVLNESRKQYSKSSGGLVIELQCDEGERRFWDVV